MKNIFKLSISMLLAAFALSSCSYTELEPTDMVGPDKAFGNVSNVRKAVVGIYGKVSLRSKIVVVEYLADDAVQGGDSGGAGTDLTNWVHKATSGEVSGLWSHYYGIINQTNRVLYYGPKVKVQSPADEALLHESLGTAYFFRAYAHFELLSLFSNFYDDQAAGIPYISHYHVVGNPKRDMVGECYEQIMTDLNRSYDMLRVVSPDLTQPNTSLNSSAYISQAAVDALRARVSLYHKKYTHAYIYASNALRAIGGIVKLEDVSKVWTEKSNAGVIFKLSRPSGSGTIGTIFVGRDYSSVFRPSNDLRALYTTNDVRSETFLLYGRDRAGQPTWMSTKWFGDASDIGRVDEKIFRAEEMQLIAIEALALREGPDMALANRMLNELRAQRITNHVAANYDNLIPEIIKERRLEFVWEGHRMADARRLQFSLSREGKTLTWDDHRMTLPIPQAEIDANSNINAEDQNYGY